MAIEPTTGRRIYDFLSKRKIFMTISSVAVLASLILMFVPGPRFGIDFAGGTNIILRFTTDVTVDEVRSAVQDLGFEDAAVQRFGGVDDGQYLVETQAVTGITAEQETSLRDAIVAQFGERVSVLIDDSSGGRIYVRLPREAYPALADDEDATMTPGEYAPEVERLTNEIFAATGRAGFENFEVSQLGSAADRRFAIQTQGLQMRIEAEFAESFGERFEAIDRIETVGPRVGQQLREDSLKAVLFSLVAILLYIAFRFDLRYAPAAVAALFHDVAITLGIFVILREEISLPIIAALLTIVGYSLNDTIVTFDRVRENLQLAGGGKVNMLELVNKSINECLSRTVLTSMTTFVAVAMIFIFGGGLIKSFALAMMIGVLVGTYSSIYIASPLLVWLDGWFEKRRKSKAEEKRLIDGPTVTKGGAVV